MNEEWRNEIVTKGAAIDAQEAYMADHPLDGYEDELALIDILRNLPSAQPECKQECMPMYADVSDCISRQDTVDVIASMITYHKTLDDAYWYVKDDAPSAQPERPKGKWVWNEDGMDWGLGAWCCSECGRKPETWWESDKRHNPLRCAGSRFCGNCGADMRGEQDG